MSSIELSAPGGRRSGTKPCMALLLNLPQQWAHGKHPINPCWLLEIISLQACKIDGRKLFWEVGVTGSNISGAINLSRSLAWSGNTKTFCGESSGVHIEE